MKLFFLLKLNINNYNSNLVTNQLSKNHRQKKNIFLAKIERMKWIGRLINTKMKNIKMI